MANQRAGWRPRHSRYSACRRVLAGCMPYESPPGRCIFGGKDEPRTLRKSCAADGDDLEPRSESEVAARAIIHSIKKFNDLDGARKGNEEGLRVFVAFGPPSRGRLLIMTNGEATTENSQHLVWKSNELKVREATAERKNVTRLQSVVVHEFTIERALTS